MSTKRSRTSTSSPSSSSSSLSPTPTPKASRTLSVNGSAVVHPLLCTLPPTCNHKPTPIANSKDLEAHYATYHAHVCEEPGCRCVFPDARLLELHLTECHDSLAAVRRERGEKIFACFLSTCPKRFLTPKARRLHLIQAHTYPKEYFFAVTNKGVGGLLKKWGEGASMIRKEWKSRENDQSVSESSNRMKSSTLTEEEETQSDTENSTGDDVTVSGEDALEAGEEVDAENEMDGRTNGVSFTGAPHTRQIQGGKREQNDHHRHNYKPNSTEDAMAIDNLADIMSSLSLVPSQIRFGRGGTRGLTHPRGQPHPHTHNATRGRGSGRGGSGGVHGPGPVPLNANVNSNTATATNSNNAGMDIDASTSSSVPAPAQAQFAPRGRGNYRGRPGIIPMRGGMGMGMGAGNGFKYGRGRGCGVGHTQRGRGTPV